MDDLSKDASRLARERALEKVRKLLRLARDGAASEQEAETAARQAEAIMRQHQIQEAETLLVQVEDDLAFSRELAAANPDHRGGHRFEKVPSWVGFVAVGVGALFTCKVDVVRTNAGLKLRYSGHELDARVAAWTHDALCAAVHRLSKERAWPTRREATAFRHGCGARLQKRLRALRAERDRQDRRPGAPGTALALFDRKAVRVA